MLPFGAEPLGSGIVLFKNKINVPDELTSFLYSLKEESKVKHYSYVCDENGNQIYATNKSGHRFKLEDIDKNCSRITDFYDSCTQDWQSDFFRSCEKAIYQSMIEYASMYPMVLPCLWWKTHGHVLAYGPGSDLGLHCDNDINFSPGFEPDFQLGIRHVLAAITYFNSSKDTVDDDNFVGGKITFPYAGVTYTPEKGDILMFPGNYMCAHQVDEVSAGNRYAFLEYFGQGSSDQDRGVNVSYPSPNTTSGQTWMPDLFEDYRKYVIQYYGESYDEHKLLPVNRVFHSSNTKKEVAN